MNTTVLPDNARCNSAHRGRRLDLQLACELVQGLEIVRLGEELDQFLDQRRADAVDIVQLGTSFRITAGKLQHSRAPAVEAAIVAGQDLGVDLADEADAQRVDEPLERNPASGLDRRLELLDLLGAPQPSSSASLASSLCVPARRNRSTGLLTRPASSSCGTCFLPSPSMSKASRATKWRSRSASWAGQISPPVQRRMASPSGAHGERAA